MNKSTCQVISKKQCPKCNIDMFYKNKQNLKYSIVNNVICKECKISYRNSISKERKCPKCNKNIIYKNINACRNSEKNKKLCKSCAITLSCSRPERQRLMSERMLGENNPMYGKTGRQCPFYGKKHTEESKRKQSELRKGKPITERHRENIKKYYKNHDNPMKGRSVYSVWINKYGKEKADKLMEDYKYKQSLNNKGENNPMYGKPSPKGSGQGWKGWYNGIYFRSLRELSYMMYMDENNIKWKSAETKELSIKYIGVDNQERTYRADFILTELKKLIEIKPIRLQSSQSIKLKTNAAIEFCQNNNLVFEIIDFAIDYNKIKVALDMGIIKFDRNYKEKFLKYIKKN